MSVLLITLLPVEAERPVAGLQEYDDAPAASKVTAIPEHTAGLSGDTVTLGDGNIVTGKLAVLLQPVVSFL